MPVKKLSVKIKITIWLTALVAVLTVVLVAMAMFVSGYVASQEASNQLSATVRSNLDYITAGETMPVIDEKFAYYHNGVTTLVYSKNGSLVAGQLPVNFKVNEAFDNGAVRTVESGENKFMVVDIWLPADWNNGVWIRGITDVPDNNYMIKYLLHISAITLPLFTLMAALGSYFIIKGAFRPLEKITATAEEINEAKDLSGRINLPETGDEFSRLAENFDNMFERLERSFEAEKQFTADASHELRTPVAIIKSACEYAEKYDETQEDHKETISMIHRQADKMAVLIHQLLSMTRMEQGTEKLNFKDVDLAELTETVVKEQKWSADRIKLNVQKNVMINADADLLARLLRNLVENSLKYGLPDGDISIGVSETKDEALLAVQDQGEGISDEHIDKIWQRFYQADSSRNSDINSGTGLGLSIVQQIAKLHKGYMTVESKKGSGSVFTLHLPKANR